MLRACYPVKMRFVPGGPLVPVVWYRVPDDRPGIGIYHRFSSRNYGREASPDGLGEQFQFKRRFLAPAPPALFLGGKGPDGPLSVWAGNGPTDAPPLPLRLDGFPLGCPYGPGGGVAGGAAVQVLGRLNQLGQGGAVAGGAAVIATGYGLVGQGGAVAGGAAVIATGYGLVGQGGALAGGAAYFAAGVAVIGQGGAVAGGAAVIATGYGLVGSGGGLAGGAAELATGYGLVAAGGATGGGAAPVADSALLLAQGGALGGGAAELATGYGLVAAGGALGGGEATVEPGYQLTAGGGALGGGAATQGPAATCQPWLNSQTVTYTDPVYGAQTLTQGAPGLDYQVNPSGAPPQTVIWHNNGGTCGSGTQGLLNARDSLHFQSATFVSYDSSTGVGTWSFASGALWISGATIHLKAV